MDSPDQHKPLEDEMIGRLRSFGGKTGQWTVVHAADPLNLVGTLLAREGERIPVTHKVALAILDGELVAKTQGPEVIFLKALPAHLESEIRQSLQLMGSFRSKYWQRIRPAAH